MYELESVLNYYQIPFSSDDDKIMCPFHADKNPSLKIDITKNFWHCFGCELSGDAYKFHKLCQENIGVTNEIKILQLYTKIIKGGSKSKSKVVRASEEILKDASYFRQMMIEAKDYYYGLKTVDWIRCEGEEAEYMKWRGFTKTSLNKFGAKLTYKYYYPIIFPILDNGKFMGWVSRTTDFETSKTRKYLYNKGFRRNKTLGGNYKKTKVVMVVEGYFDMLKAKQMGAKNVVALFGWKMTDNQCKKLKESGVTHIISALDNDKAGEKGNDYLKHLFKTIPFKYPNGTKDMGEIAKGDYKKAIKIINKTLEKENLKWE